MGITKKDAEKHLARLARRRARYAEKKRQNADRVDRPVMSPPHDTRLAFGIGKSWTAWELFLDEMNTRPQDVMAAVNRLGLAEVAATPRAPEQLTLFPMPPRAFVMGTAKEQAEFDLKQRNLGREWIKQILAQMEE
jgi:hypothetical protein